MQFISLIEKIYTKPYLRIALHLLFWVVMFGVRLYFTYISFNVYHTFPVLVYTLLNIYSTLSLAGFYYALVYFVIPVLLIKKRYLQGLIFILLMIPLYITTDAYTEIHLVANCDACTLSLKKNSPDYASYLSHGLNHVVLTRLVSQGTLLYLIVVMCFPFSIKMSLQAFRNKVQSLQLARDNLQLELNFLKAQLNPHFLFNSMNNIYGLIISGDKERSAALVARLSELLRYTLYDADNETMPIEKEVKLLQDYIELEKVRLNDTRVNFTYNAADKNYQIAPLLLMPLIENAFKYSGDHAQSFIDMDLHILNNQLQLTVKNSIDTNRTANIAGGIGLTNFKKRMDLYYPKRYTYQTGINGSTYSVNLTIQL